MTRYPPYPRSPFAQLARWTAKASGHPLGFMLAVLVILAWAATGPLFGFSDTWQLVINTGTTIVTFLMVFLIQNTQNHDGAVVQLKLDELIRAERNAHNALLDLDELTDRELERLRRHYLELARRAREELRRRGQDTGSPELGLDWAIGQDESGP
ncbi:MAG: low affinity iron permease family protein [Chloroflexota bacterium]|jgi:low affinity Fe/Cu permease|nr:low affinity iron permease family protein [Chloroflexota bacterium]